MSEFNIVNESINESRRYRGIELLGQLKTENMSSAICILIIIMPICAAHHPRYGAYLLRIFKIVFCKFYPGCGAGEAIGEITGLDLKLITSLKATSLETRSEATKEQL